MVHSRRTILSKLQTLKQPPPVTPLGKLKSRKTLATTAAAPSQLIPNITALIRRPGADIPEPLQPEQISEEIHESGALLWVDIRDPGQAQLTMLNHEFDFSPLSLECDGSSVSTRAHRRR